MMPVQKLCTKIDIVLFIQNIEDILVKIHIYKMEIKLKNISVLVY